MPFLPTSERIGFTAESAEGAEHTTSDHLQNYSALSAFSAVNSFLRAIIGRAV